MKNYLLVASMLFLAGCGGRATSDPPLGPEKTSLGIVQPYPTPTPVATETDEEKAVRLAEEFVRRNGYTESPADRDHLTYESIEFSANIDELLASRKDTLEPKAYGISPGGKGTEKGWTVVFHYRKVRGTEKPNEKTGRAVTMDENFQALKMQHVDFILNKVQKKL